VDSGQQTEQVWLLNVQTKLYQWSRENTDQPYRELWNWVTDPRNLRCAWRHIATNKGKRTPGVDGETVGSIRRDKGEAAFLDGLRRELRTDSYRPSPCRRKMIPKRGKPGKFRPLGIPTIKDRVVQCAVKQIVEPIFEAGFWHVSYGFRPGRGCHGALEHIRMTIRPRATAADGLRRNPPYQWVIEGDIKGCFDHIDHYSLMQRVRGRIADRKVNRLLVQFLKAGVLTEEQLLRTPAGTPQGGVISPLLANIALSAIEEKYERWVNHQSKIRQSRKSDGLKAAMYARSSDRQAGRTVFFPVRYADDFVVLVSGNREDALVEKEALAGFLQETLRLELSPEKTRVTSLFDGFEFLGHRVRLRWDPRFGYSPRLEIPKAKLSDLRHRVKQLTRRNRVPLSLSRQLRDLNPILRGWGYFYRYCTNAKKPFVQLDWYVGDRLWRWMREKHPKAGARWLAQQRRRSTKGSRMVWQADQYEQFLMGRIPVRRYRRGWMGSPDYARTPGEPDA
jgi:group II intron reverse transcriptase/maturase